MKKLFHFLKNWWSNLSLSVKTLLLQTILIVTPLGLCILVIVHSVTADLLINSARTSYDYGRYTMNSFEAEMLQIKAAANVVVESRLVTSMLSSREGSSAEEKQRVLTFIQNTIRTNRNVEQVTLYVTGNAAEHLHEQFPVWEEESVASSSWKIRSSAEELNIAWVQPVRSDGRVLGVLSIELYPHALVNVAESIGRMSGKAALILSSDGEVMYSSAPIPGKEKGTRISSDLSEGYRTEDENTYLNIFHCSAMNIVVMAYGGIRGDNILFGRRQGSFLWIFAGLAVLFLLAAVLNYMSVTRRIKRLSSQINYQIRRIEDSPHLPDPEEMAITGKDEIGQLSRDFSNLQHQLFLSAQQEKKLEMLQQTAKFSALQAQIQPHFLYNTLESLRMMAYEHDDAEVAEMIFTLGKLMRSSISGKKQETTLKNELENAENYLILNKLRFETLSYDISCTLDASGIVCPKFILQPIVENSIYHGVSRNRKERVIHIRAYSEDAHVTVEVQDNGPGIDPQRLEDIRKALAAGTPLEQVQGGIGLVNVHSRLKIFFGEESGLELMSTPGGGTVCRIHICLNGKKR